MWRMWIPIYQGRIKLPRYEWQWATRCVETLWISLDQCQYKNINRNLNYAQDRYHLQKWESFISCQWKCLIAEGPWGVKHPGFVAEGPSWINKECFIARGPAGKKIALLQKAQQKKLNKHWFIIVFVWYFCLATDMTESSSFYYLHVPFVWTKYKSSIRILTHCTEYSWEVVTWYQEGLGMVSDVLENCLIFVWLTSVCNGKLC